MKDLGTLGTGTWSWAFGINDSDQVVGASYYQLGANATHPFLYSEVVMIDLTPGAGCCGSAYDINNAGHIVGVTPNSQAFLYSGGVLNEIGPSSEARGINNYDQVVGWSYIPGPYPHAFIYEDGVMADLNSLLPEGSGWVLNYALDINDIGQIVGIGTTNGQSHAFLLSPVILGDINRDGRVDISDVIFDLRCALGLSIEPYQCLPCADINGDGKVDISDVILTLRMALGLDPLKPCTE